MTAWVEHAIWWHVYPLGFTGAEQDALPPDHEPEPRLRHLGAWLDYAVELGCNGLALGPVFASETHGYDTVDHYRVDRRLGTADDLRWLIDACHEKGVRVLLDGVFNHVGRGFDRFQAVLADGPESESADWFHIYPDNTAADGFTYEHFEGHDGLVTLNHGHPEVRRYVIEVMRHWLDAGADGWRLDAAYAAPRDFWHEVVAEVKEHHPDAWLVGEVIHAPYEPWIEEAGLDAVTQYELWKSIWSSINDRNFYELSWTLERHQACSERFVPLTFLGNHDVTRIATQIEDDRHLGHAIATLLTLPGTPSIYAGDEQAFTGVKGDHARGDDAVRPEFPATPDDLLPYGWSTYRRWQEMISLRRRHPWLARATVEVHDLANESIGYVCSSTARDDDARLAVLLNLGDQPTAFPEAQQAVPAAKVEAASFDADEGATIGEVPPHGWAILA